MPSLPPPDQVASAIVRQAEDLQKVERIAKQQEEMEKRRREEAMREAEAAKRQQQSGQKR